MENKPFTDKEKEIMNLIVQAHIKFCELESTHTSEMNDWVSGIHKLQDVLGSRVLRRDYPETFITIKK